MRSPLSYYGGKARLAPWIVSLLGPHRCYIEPFFGSGAVLFAKPKCPHEIINDLDGNVVNYFRVLRDRPTELRAVCELTPYARDEFKAAKLDGQDLDELERARRYWVRSSQAFNQAATETSRATWATSSVRGSNMATTVRNALDRFAPAAERLLGCSIESDDACAVIERYGHARDTVIYVDPPYDPDTRSRARDYAIEMDQDGHRRLAATLHVTSAKVLLSGYSGPLYDELYGDWHRVERTVHRPASNHGDDSKRHAVEVLWSNRPFPADDLFSMVGA